MIHKRELVGDKRLKTYTSHYPLLDKGGKTCHQSAFEMYTQKIKIRGLVASGRCLSILPSDLRGKTGHRPVVASVAVN